MTLQTERQQAQIEQRLASAMPRVEVLVCERVGNVRMRLVIDHPDGVDLDLCARVTSELRDMLEEVGLEVSSPGPERPLTKPDHFRRFVGRRARVRTRNPRDGHRSFTGELVGATDEDITIAAADGVISIAHAEIARGNLLTGEGHGNTARRRDQ